LITEELIWSYKEDNKEVLLALPVEKRRANISSWKGPHIKGDIELWKKLRNKNIQ
jgi:hypothetical protein